MASPSNLCVTLRIDAREAELDIERIENGELELPTVTAVHVSCDGIFEEDLPIWLDEL